MTQFWPATQAAREEMRNRKHIKEVTFRSFVQNKFALTCSLNLLLICGLVAAEEYSRDSNSQLCNLIVNCNMFYGSGLLGPKNAANKDEFLKGLFESS